MAIEAVLSLGLSLIVAIGAIGAFGSYRDTVMDKIEERDSDLIKSRVLSAAYNVKDADSGTSITLKLPESDQDYQVSVNDDELLVSTTDNSYTVKTRNMGWTGLRGSATGPDIEVAKINNEIVLGEG